ncbi:hypothetical protein Q9L58_004149 [Maublancomyces gigas]|uniref:Uncharacterized protein n=1 Tax=Discina gigas TaxID=1032678 RepID=A0ABR3GLJ7_9PEZI
MAHQMPVWSACEECRIRRCKCIHKHTEFLLPRAGLVERREMCENVYPTIAAKPLPERHGRRAGGGRSRRGGMVLQGPVASAPAIAGKTRAGGLRVVRQTTVGGNHADSTIVRKARIKCSNSHSLGGTEETTKGLPEELALSLPHRPAFYPPTPTSIAPRSPPPHPSRWTFRRDQKADSPAQGSTPRSRFTRRAPA